MRLRNLVSASLVAVMVGLAGFPALAQKAPPSPVESVRKELLRLPYYGVFDFLSFKYDHGVVTLMG